MSSGDDKEKIRKAVHETMVALLSPIKEFRQKAEKQLEILEGALDEFAIYMTELILKQQESVSIRQLASVVLTHYVKSHWCEYSEKFKDPKAKPEIKSVVRELLPAGLRDPESKLRTGVAYAISAIAQTDWPDSWPELFQIFLVNLNSEDPAAVHGTMRALADFSHFINEAQMPKVAPEILPLLLRIFTNSQRYGNQTRGKAAQIFASCVKVISGSIENEDSLNMYLPNLPDFTVALVQSLTIPYNDFSNSGLKKDVIDALKSLIVFDARLNEWLPNVLQHSLILLGNCSQLFINAVTSDARGDDDVDSDGESGGYNGLALSILDFLHCLVESSKCRSQFLECLPDLVYLLISNMQITEEQIRIWNTDIERFVECEQENPSAYSVRIASQELLKMIAHQFEEKTAVGLCGAITRHIQEAEARPNEQWWKIHEACMVALEIVHECIANQLQVCDLQFNMIGFLQSVLLKDMCLLVSPFLLGRCLTAGSCYLAFMGDQVTQTFLNATVTGLNQENHPCIMVCAARAVYRVCDHFNSIKKPECLHPYLPTMFEKLLIFLHNNSSSLFTASDLLTLALESIAMVISVDENFTCSIEQQIVPLTINIFWKQCGDSMVMELVKDIIKQLCRFPHCLELLQQKLLPELLPKMIQRDRNLPLGLQAASLDVMHTIVKHSPLPLSEAMITQVFPAVVQCILLSDENLVFQNGGECLQAFILTSMDQIARWRDAELHTGLQYIFKVIQTVLDPNAVESKTTCIGSVISALIQKDALGDMTKQICCMMVNRLQHLNSISATQTLMMVFARMFLKNMEQMLNLLDGITFSEGQSALIFILMKWSTCHYMFLGVKDTQMSAFSLSKVLEYCINHNDPRIKAIEVPDPIIVIDDVVKTRSQAVNNTNSEICPVVPIIVKIHKILIQELYHCYLAEDSLNESGNGVDKQSAEQEQKKEENNLVALQDPLRGVNFKQYLIEYLVKLSQLPNYGSFVNYLGQHEKAILPIFDIPC